MSQERPDRKHPAHGIHFKNGKPTLIFDTVCTKNRLPWLTDNGVHQLLRSVWQEADAWLMGQYVIMPDHIHFFATPTEPFIDYEKWVTYWKSIFTKKHGDPRHQWLTDHWDTRVRSKKQYAEKWEYVRWNPVRHELVKSPDEWPFQGTINVLSWN